MGDRDLLAKLAAAGDMVTLEAKYNSHSLASLYNRCRTNAYVNNENVSRQEKRLQGIAFAKTISFIEEFFEEMDTSGVPHLRLADLAKMYIAKLEDLGANASNVNSTRLKKRILSTLPDVSAHPQGKHILFISDQDVGEAIKLVNELDADAEAVHLARAARIVRKDILRQNQSFEGTCDTECQENAIPQTLKALINFILKGPSSSSKKADTEETEEDINENQAFRSISRLVIYNTIVHQKKKPSATARHPREREIPLSIYVALKITGLTRGRSLIDARFNLGLCISYDRVLNICTDLRKTG